jgi:chromosome segregation ATPase
MSQLRGQIESLEHHLNNQDAETRRLSNQLEESQRLKGQFQQASQKYNDEAVNLSSDLQALTRENQMLNSSNQKVCCDNYRL